MLYAYLILGHLIGDFALQSNKLIQWKNRSCLGTMVHVLILLVISFVFVMPYLYSKVFIIGLLVVYFSHLIEDILKIEFTKRFPQYEFTAFIWDQCFHFSVLFVFYDYFKNLEARFFEPFSNFIYSDFRISILLILLIVVTYTWDIFGFQIALLKGQKIAYKRNYIAMLKRAALFTAIYILLIFAFT